MLFLYSDHTKKSTANKTDKEGTTQEDVDAGNAKKQWKFDAAIESLVSIAFDAEREGTGSLAVNSDNEGIETYLH